MSSSLTNAVRFPVDFADPVVVAAERLRHVLHRDAVARDKAGGRPIAQVALLKETGLPSARIDAEYGGAGRLGFRYCVRSARLPARTGRSRISSAITICRCMPCWPSVVRSSGRSG